MFESLALKSKDNPRACRDMKASPFFSLPLLDFAEIFFNLIKSEKKQFKHYHILIEINGK